MHRKPTTWFKSRVLGHRLLKIDFGATKGQLPPQESLTIVRRPHGMTTSSLLSRVFAVLALSSSAAQSPEKWQKILLTDAAKSGAVCLDGSPGGFYLRRGSANKWIVFHQGGGWCGSPDNCLERAGTNLGSSKNWPDTYTDAYEGSAMFDYPPFNEFNVVYAMYCDGGSWAGNTTQVVGNTTVYYKGRPLLDALLDVLLGMGLKSADELLYSGCSAGGLTTYLHTDYVRSRVPASVKMVALADAMFSLPYDNVGGVASYPSVMQFVYSAMNTFESVDSDCAAHYGRDMAWMCMFGAVGSRFVQTPLFILNSNYDSWQQAAIIGLGDCRGKEPDDKPPMCKNTTERAYWNDYTHVMLSNLTLVPPRHGAFLTNCVAHCQTGTGGDYMRRSVDGITMGNAISTWYNATIGGSTTDPAPRWVAKCDYEPCGTDVC